MTWAQSQQAERPVQQPGIMVPIDLSTLPPGTRIEYHEHDSSSTGAGFRGPADAAGNFEAGGVSVSGGEASAGGLLAKWDGPPAGSDASVLLIAGIAAVLGGAALAALGRVKQGAWVAAAGGALIALSWFFAEAGWFFWLAGLAALAGVAWFVWSEFDGGRANEALRAVVRGVSEAPEQARREVKQQVAKHATPQTSAKIDSTKRRA